MTSRFALGISRQRARLWRLGLAVSLAAGAARAEDDLELTWEAPPGCPSAALVRQRLGALAGGDARLAGAHVHAEGRIEQADGGYRLTLIVHDGARVGKRTVESVSCLDLGRAAAVALGLFLQNAADGVETTSGTETAPARDEPGTRTETSATNAATAGTASERPPAPAASSATARPQERARREPAPAAQSPSSEAAASRAEEDAARRGRRRWRVLVRLPFASLDLGPLPKPSGALGAALGVRYDAWRVLLGGRLFAAQTLAPAGTQEASVRLRRFALAATVCRGFRARALELAPCVAVGAEPLSAAGHGQNLQAQRTRATTVVLSGGVEADWYLVDWMALAGSVALGLETTRPRFFADVPGGDRTLLPVEFSLGIGPEWIF